MCSLLTCVILLAMRFTAHILDYTFSNKFGLKRDEEKANKR